MCIKAGKCSKIVSKNYYFIKKLRDLGMCEDYLGFYYLVDILDILINQSKVVRSFSREVYPVLSSKYGKNPCTFERNIRNTINVLWDIRLKHKLSEFWRANFKPSCREFIYILKNYLLMTIA